MASKQAIFLAVLVATTFAYNEGSDNEAYTSDYMQKFLASYYRPQYYMHPSIDDSVQFPIDKLRSEPIFLTSGDDNILDSYVTQSKLLKAKAALKRSDNSGFKRGNNFKLRILQQGARGFG
uniref:Uncharacterized protein n=1 Tax=Rhabditophanes sp. KR3021 TaxID=114890 RepID=A0AC35UIA8_9BILA